MKRWTACMLALTLALLLCACGGGGKSLKVELPYGLRFGMSQEEVEAKLGKADRKTSSNMSYFVDYSSRPEGFDSEKKLSPKQSYLLTEYSKGKLSVVTFSFDLGQDKYKDLDGVLSQADKYYTKKLGDPMKTDMYGNSMILWTDGKFELSIVAVSEGGPIPHKSVMVMFRYDDEK